MTVPRSMLAAITLALVLAPPAALAAEPAPVVELKATVSPDRLPIPNGTPMTLRLDTTFASEPPGGSFVLERLVYRFGRGARFNGALFPSCSVAKLKAAHGALRACPKGSRVGSGVGTGTAVALGITSTGTLTVFNGPGGRSLTINVKVVHPAAINATFSAPIVKLRGRYRFKLSTSVPNALKTVLGADIVVRRLDVSAGATRVVDGVKRGYFEAENCPANGSAIHGDFGFSGGARASVHKTVVC